MRQADSLMVIFVKEARATDIVANWMRKKLVGAGLVGGIMLFARVFLE